MLDVKLLRESPEVVRKNLERRSLSPKVPLVEEALRVDRDWRNLKTRVEELRHTQNQLTVEVANLKKQGKSIAGKLKEIEDIPERIRSLDSEAEKSYSRLQEIMLTLPNLLDETVPDGKDESDNLLLRSWGQPRKFEFEPKHHIDLLTELGMVEVERAAKIAGARTFFLEGEMVRLEHSIMRYAIDLLTRKGFKPIEPPFMMSRRAYEGVVDLAAFGPVIYKVEGEDLHLIATSEHPLVAMHMDEILKGSSLPIRYCGFSPCFRVEAGAHGKDTKVVFRTPEESRSLHEELIGNAEEVFRNLGLPHRVVTLCSGDTGATAAKTYDLEAWLPAQGRFREMVSASNVTDYQARRLKIRYRDKQSEQTKLVHTLNSTAVTTRALVAVVENYQQADGSIAVPKVLVPYMGLDLITASWIVE